MLSHFLLQLEDYNTVSLPNIVKRPSLLQLRKQKLQIHLQGNSLFYSILFSILLFWNNYLYGHFYFTTEKYVAVDAKWTTERCAVCRWVEDWDDNKIIICNRYTNINTLNYS